MRAKYVAAILVILPLALAAVQISSGKIVSSTNLLDIYANLIVHGDMQTNNITATGSVSAASLTTTGGAVIGGTVVTSNLKDLQNSAYYVDPAGTSNIYALLTSKMIETPTIWLDKYGNVTIEYNSATDAVRISGNTLDMSVKEVCLNGKCISDWSQAYSGSGVKVTIWCGRIVGKQYAGWGTHYGCTGYPSCPSGWTSLGNSEEATGYTQISGADVQLLSENLGTVCQAPSTIKECIVVSCTYAIKHYGVPEPTIGWTSVYGCSAAPSCPTGWTQVTTMQTINDIRYINNNTYVLGSRMSLCCR